jgi:hypothetical protein
LEDLSLVATVEKAPSKTELRAWLALVMVGAMLVTFFIFIAEAAWSGRLNITVQGNIDPNLIVGFIVGFATSAALWLWREKPPPS